MRSIGQVLDRYDGIGPGFHVIRLFLSISVVCWHSVVASYGSDEQALMNPWSAIPSAILPMFFGLSGFLVMGSALRQRNLKNFIFFRGARMIPALAVEITISALLFGAILTTVPLGQYFTSNEFFEYFGSLVGRIRYILPGVFEDNPFPRIVNISLWTIPGELLSYSYLAVLMVTGTYLSTRAILASAILLGGVFLWADLTFGAELVGQRMPMQYLLMSYVFGTLIYAARYHIPYGWGAFALSVVLGLALMRTVGLGYIGVFFITYAIVFLGMTRIPTAKIFRTGDYSYGIYLYGFPIQQLMVYLFPGYREWYWNIAFSLPVVVLIAVFSWHVVEKPALALRKFVPPTRGLQLFERGKIQLWLVLWAILSYAYFIAGHSRLYAIGSVTREEKFMVVGLLALLAAAIVGLMSLRTNRAARKTGADVASRHDGQDVRDRGIERPGETVPARRS